ncbi:MAG: SDR family NAD(P)-dependent oxidoreductase [Verrucomicrobiota bacterium]
MKERALITGASSGIGLELARVFAKKGHPLFLTAPVDSELSQIATELQSEHGVDIQWLAQNLEQDGAEQNIYRAAEKSGPVEILVNDAGLGQKGNFWEIPLEKYDSILHVNIRAVIRLSHFFLPAMLQRGYGRLVNIASIAGFEPGPLLAVYHASKAFVLSLTESLAVELEDTGISVTAICPGATDTDFFPKADMIDTRMFQKGNVMAPQDVAAKAYKAIMAGDPLYIPGGRNKALAFSRRFLTKKTQAKQSKVFYEDVSRPGTRERESGDVRAEAGKN